MSDEANDVETSSRARDESMRTEFAKAFGWKTQKNQWSNEDAYRIPTWGEILVETGKLLAKQEALDNRQAMDRLQGEMEYLRGSVERVENEVKESPRR